MHFEDPTKLNSSQSQPLIKLSSFQLRDTLTPFSCFFYTYLLSFVPEIRRFFGFTHLNYSLIKSTSLYIQFLVFSQSKPLTKRLLRRETTMAASASERPQFISNNGGNSSFSDAPLIDNSDPNQIIVPEVWFLKNMVQILFIITTQSPSFRFCS